MSTEVATARPKSLSSWEGFQTEIIARKAELASQLPSNVSPDRFVNAAIAAVKQNPEILKATPRSLFAAITKAAQDGLIPDGREGVITVYKTDAAWNPMFFGIRKRARELDGIIIDAQVVFVGDEFDYELGDNPFIKHKPKARTEKTDASAGVAVYAIFRHPTEGILHREVMWKPDVFDVMNQSRAKGSLMWTTFWTEGWKKTCGRRASKSVPVSPALERLITRDDENFDFSHDPSPTRTIAPPTPPEDEPDDTPPSNEPEKIIEPDTPADEETIDVAATLTKIEETLATAQTIESLDELWDELSPGTDFADDEDAFDLASKIYARHKARIERKALEAAGQGSLLGDDLPEETRTAHRLGNTP